ncbi:hypothetical protein L8P34_16420 [Enterobacter kobei]|uniref:hypothetical protein n=1 Tax=Enterobacter cloacae complex TaxID=354276 RepID=UPI0020053C6A|nr:MULTISPECIES: hypothetical protein [Enterobacter]MCK7113130.1 hypothetical protein [Enterobacter kobei]HCM9199149.1 hypothetical protein [Enterobacter hormaechei subsp. xiangfangensis]HDC4434684.1 hypothetical protein [Enterobacter cloacae]
MNNPITSEEIFDEMLKILFSDDFLNPPFELEKDIISDFDERCNKYIELLTKYKEKYNTKLRFDLLITRVTELRDGIENCFQNFLSGDIKEAYVSLEDVLETEKIMKHIQHITIPLKSICNKDKPLYRVRKSEKPISKRAEIFHIPFSKRHLVGAQRYSVDGLPCLYLGTSLYVCWQEMNKPDFDKLYISAFTTTDDKSRILNFAPSLLSYIPQDESSITNISQRKASYLTLWPLIIACSYKKTHPDSKFTQEYIVSNLLMQWISQRIKSQIVGIAYFSTHMKKTKNSTRSINVVFPPKSTYKQTNDFEYSPKLSSLFNFTPPVSWQVLKTLDYQLTMVQTKEQAEAINHLRNREVISGITDFDVDLIRLYPLTDFYKLEVYIDRLFDYNSIDAIS